MLDQRCPHCNFNFSTDSETVLLMASLGEHAFRCPSCTGFVLAKIGLSYDIWPLFEEEEGKNNDAEPTSP